MAEYSQSVPNCYRHPSEPAYIRCQRCGRPICPKCMIQAPVGFQCPECVTLGAKQTRQHALPYGGERSANPALTTLILVGINVAIWLLIVATGGGLEALWSGMDIGSVGRWLELSPLGMCLTADAASYAPGMGQAFCQQIPGMMWSPGVLEAPWQVITSAFAHVELWHIGFNMVALWFLGPQLESVFGRARLLAIYFVSALAGSATVLWFSDLQTATLGASGAIFGLLGALLLLAWKVKGNVQSILIWLGINLIYTFTVASISWQGHLGGLVGGAAASAILVFAPKENRKLVQLLGICGLFVVVIALIVLRILNLPSMS